MDTVARTEMVESELDGLVRRRHDQRVNGEQQRIEDAWEPSVQLHNARLEAENRAAWRAFHEAQAKRHRTTLEDLISRHEQAAARLSESEPKEQTA